MDKFFTNENQLEDWIEAALSIKEEFGIEKAIGYLIGEKFYGVIKSKQGCKEMMKMIEQQRAKPDYNPIRKSTYAGREYVSNLDEDYEDEKKKILVIEDILNEFAELIKESFEQYEIKGFLDSNPRFGPLGHICSEEEHAYLAKNEAVKHSIDTEVNDALIFGDIKKYFEL